MPVNIVSPRVLRHASERREHRYTIIDARTLSEYDAGHVPGALWTGWEDWCRQPPDGSSAVLAQPGYWGLLEDYRCDRIRCKLGSLGITLADPILVYGDGRSSVGREGRIAWMLLYLGAQEVALLDGGWSNWRDSGGAVDRSRPALQPAVPAVRLQPARRVNLNALRCLYAGAGLPCLVDTRTPQEFFGQCHEYIPRPGRLPRSVLLNFDDLFQADGSYVPRSKYLSLLPDEVASGQPFIAYCEVGVRAATFALLHEAYTREIVPVFDGSLMQWSLDPQLPVLCN